MDPNALYYLFSTVSQTVAAAAGFLAAFVLLRLQSWDAVISDSLRLVRLNMPSVALKAIAPAVESGREPGYRAAWQEQVDLRKLTDLTLPHVDMHFLTLLDLVPKRKRLLRRFWMALGAAGATIAVSLILIPFAQALASGRGLGGIAATVVVLASCTAAGILLTLAVRAVVAIEPIAETGATNAASPAGAAPAAGE